jgi:uncharacterized protein YndB with AHSA1/START domain
MTVAVPDRIEKTIMLRAPRARVWRALSNADEFGSWFGMKFNGQFAPGARLRGVMTPTTVDPEVASLQKPHEGMPFEIIIDRIEPERLFSFRWHPFAIDASVDYSQEPTTLIVFELEQVGTDIKLTVTESGFDQIPLERRAQAFTANDDGWTMVVKLIEKYLAKTN